MWERKRDDNDDESSLVFLLFVKRMRKRWVQITVSYSHLVSSSLPQPTLSITHSSFFLSFPTNRNINHNRYLFSVSVMREKDKNVWSLVKKVEKHERTGMNGMSSFSLGIGWRESCLDSSSPAFPVDVSNLKDVPLRDGRGES